MRWRRASRLHVAIVLAACIVVPAETCVRLSPDAYVASILVPQDYDKTAHPGLAQGEPTTVEVHFRLTHLTEISEIAGSLKAIGYLYLWWSDPRLAFEATSCTPQVSMRKRLGQHIWMPDLQVQNLVQREDEANHGEGYTVHVYPNGTVWATMFRALRLSVSFDLRELPFDVQRPTIKLGSQSEDASEVVVIPRGGSPTEGSPGTGVGLAGDNLTSFVWTIEEGQAEFAKPAIFSIENNRAFVTLSWSMHRQVGFFWRQVIWPSVLFLAIGYLQFWVAGTATPARALLATLPVLIFRSLSSDVYSALPKGGSPILLSSYLTVSLTLCIVAALHFALVQYCLLVEKTRSDRRVALLQAAKSIQRLAQQCKERGVKMGDLVKQLTAEEPEHVAQNTEVELSVMNAIVSSATAPYLAPSQGNLLEKDLAILGFTASYFETFDSNKNGDLAIDELQKLLTHFDWYVSSPQLASAVCGWFRDQGQSTPAEEKDVSMLFESFAPFMVVAVEYIPLYQMEQPAFWLRDRLATQRPSLAVDKAMRILYPIAFVVIFSYFFIF